jgi:cellulose synthase/poly-beta-1,6-N-acetylglucosamine synthase-like glycosyltransferase/peptidoglycan/xylan/chitin deacetylase (PgdA/CDA1 family)
LLLGTFALFVFGLSFATIKRPSITYRDAIERYHYYYSAANQKKIALTFDDGPNGHVTQMLMDTLSESSAPATFFFIGKRALVRPDLVKEAVARGFDVEDHSFTHSEDIHSSYGRLAFELNSTSFLLSQVSEKSINIYRPPYLLGIGVDPTVNPYIETPQDVAWILKLGYLPVGSDIDSKDWLASNPEGVLEGLKHGLAASPNGHIALFHDDINTAKAMPSIVKYLNEEGYQIVPLQELITPPSGAMLALARTLQYGDNDRATGGEVSKLQWFLYSQKFLDPYALSGVFDEATRDALITYQAKNGLIDPSNPNPAQVGVTGASTREAIAAAAIASAPHPNAEQGVLQAGFRPIHDFFLTLYINLFPMARNFFVFAVFLTLILVAIRTGGLLGLLLFGALFRKKPIDKADQEGGPGVSILIPAYNEQENIAATVESVVRTQYRNREIIVIDDGSQDRTADEVRAVITAHPEERIRLISVQNGGKANALNIGVEGAAHEIIVVLDADAVLDPDAVSYFVAHMADPKVGAVAGKVRTTNASNMLDVFQTLEYAIGQNIDKTAFSMINAIGVVPGPAGAWRKSFLVAAGGFHTDTLVEDQEMTLSMLHRGHTVVYDSRAIAYTETPHSIKNFLKQRFRWVYGTMQCFWKHKSVMVEKPASSMSLVVMPNVFVYNILLPLTYPFADSALIFGLIFGEWRSLVMPFLIFTGIDLLYAIWGLRGEPNKWKLMLSVPLQRIVYRQLLYYTVYKGFVRAIEGTGTGWNKFAKTGETRRFYLSAMGGLKAALEGVKTPIGLEPQAKNQLSVVAGEVEAALQGPEGTAPASTNLQEAMSLSVMPRQFQTAGETSSPAFSPNVLIGMVEEPNTYAKSSSPFGPTTAH